MPDVPQPKKLTVSERKLLLEVLDNDFRELLNQLEPQARAWHTEQVALLKQVYGDDTTTVDAIARECEATIREAQAILDNKVAELTARGFSKNSDQQCRAYFQTHWSNTVYQESLKQLTIQFNTALADGRAAITSTWNVARRKVLLYALDNVGDAAELVKDTPSLQDILGKFLIGPKVIESADSSN